MKKTLKALLLAAMMLLSLALAACGNGASGNATEAPLSPEADYKVTITDVTGAPCNDVMAVKFMQNGQQAAMQIVKDGVAVKNMTRGDYTVELQFNGTDEEYIYDLTQAKLSREVTEVQIVISKKLGEATMDLGVGDQNHKAYFLTTGGTQITLDPNGRSYYIFTPHEAGMYQFSLSGSDVAIGYYGGTHFVQAVSAVEVVDNKFTISISQGNLGGSYVLGVDAGNGNAVFAISRIGDPAWSVEDEPWMVYNPKHNPTPYTLPAGTRLNEFDLTASADTYNLVLNENDGFYHLNSAEGPLVLVKIGKTDADSQENASNSYVAPFEMILEKSGVRRYFYDNDGNFLKKEEYSECLTIYIENVDKASGMYPLTEDLMYVIQQHGIQAGWWDSQKETYLFVDSNGNQIPGINNEIAWLFMCRYVG